MRNSGDPGLLAVPRGSLERRTQSLQRRLEEDEKQFPLDSEITCMCKDDFGSCDYILKLNTVNVVDPCLAIIDLSDFRKQWVRLPEFGVLQL